MSDKSKKASNKNKNNKRSRSHTKRGNHHEDECDDDDTRTTKRGRVHESKPKHEHKSSSKPIANEVKATPPLPVVAATATASGSKSDGQKRKNVDTSTATATLMTNAGEKWLAKSLDSELNSTRELKRPFGIPKLWIVSETCPVDKFEKLSCNICHELAWKPVCYSKCDHFVCSPCYDAYYMKTGKTHCCVCGDKVADNVIANIAPFVRREFASIHIKCPGYSEFEYENHCTVNQSFCDNEMAFFDGVDHLTTCPYESDPCIYCGALVRRRNMVDHVANFCMKRTQECKECKMEVKAGQIDIHSKYKCVASKTSCVTCVVCKIVCVKGEFIKHVQDHLISHAQLLVAEPEAALPSLEAKDQRMEAHSWIGKRVSAEALFGTHLRGTVTGVAELSSIRLIDTTYYAFVAWDDSDCMIHLLFPNTALKLEPTAAPVPSYIDLERPLAFPDSKDSKWKLEEEMENAGGDFGAMGEASLINLINSWSRGGGPGFIPSMSSLSSSSAPTQGSRLLGIFPVGTGSLSMPSVYSRPIPPFSLPMS